MVNVNNKIYIQIFTLVVESFAYYAFIYLSQLSIKHLKLATIAHSIKPYERIRSLCRPIH